MSYESTLELQRSDDGTLGLHQVTDASLAERQLRLLESIDRKLDEILDAGRCVAKGTSLSQRVLQEQVLRSRDLHRQE